MTENADMRILVVDDDPVSLDLVSTHLRLAGYQVVTAENGIKALSLLHEVQPSIAIVDWIMPKMDGLQVCREFRAAQNELFIYFIMLTVHTDKARLLEAFDSGVDDFLSKPFHQGELLARVRAAGRMVGLCEELRNQARVASQNNLALCQLNERLHEMTIVDDLTKVYNRRHAMLRLNEYWSASERYREPLSCAMIDIDHFKRVNDAHGHLRGDEILQKTAKILQQSVRASDPVCRVGGEEFLVIFPRQAAAEAATCAERCRHAIESSVFAAPDRSWPITISIGVAQRTPMMRNPDDLLRAADQALYAAKEQGRNRLIVAA